MRAAVVSDTRHEARRAVAAAVVGNILEWYDFAVNGYLATAIAKEFFPSASDLTSLLETFAAFGLGFVVRPLGGFLIGRMGDVRGRRHRLDGGCRLAARDGA